MSTGEVMTSRETLLVDTSLDNVFMTKGLIVFVGFRIRSKHVIIFRRIPESLFGVKIKWILLVAITMSSACYCISVYRWDGYVIGIKDLK